VSQGVGLSSNPSTGKKKKNLWGKKKGRNTRCRRQELKVLDNSSSTFRETKGKTENTGKLRKQNIIKGMSVELQRRS
jgi:hypothetical protein